MADVNENDTGSNAVSKQHYAVEKCGGGGVIANAYVSMQNA